MVKKYREYIKESTTPITKDEFDDEMLRVKEVLGCDYVIVDNKLRQDMGIILSAIIDIKDNNYGEDLHDELNQIKRRIESQYGVNCRIVKERYWSNMGIRSIISKLEFRIYYV
jgi:hypothetical protein